MRILHFNQHGTNIGGVEGYIADVVSALDAAGHTSHLIYFADDPGNLIADTTHIRQPKGTRLEETILEELERAVTQCQPDIAYVHAVQDPGVVRWIAQRLPTVAYVHSPHVVCPGYAQYLRRTSRVCPYGAGLVCILKAQIEDCCFGRNPLNHARRLREVHSFIRTYRQLPILVGSAFMRKLLYRNRIPWERIEILPPVLLDNPSDDFVSAPSSKRMLFVGRLTPEKGLYQLIEAIAPIEIEWELVVAGDGEELDVCRNLAERSNMTGRVRFAGWLGQSELRRLYDRSAFVVMPSLWPEPYGRVGPEAFRHGRPVVAFAVGGVTDWLEDGVTGYLVPPGDVPRLRGRIRSLLESPSQQVQMGVNAHSYASKSWDAEVHVKSLLDHFGCATAEQKGSAMSEHGVGS